VLFYTSQSLAEFWNANTRPLDRNGFGLSIEETDEQAALIETQLTLAADSEAVHRAWRKIVVDNRVSGVQVHDARLVAAMRVHGLENLLTLNIQDFRRYRDIEAVTPSEVLRKN
jgi:predicted nucleic acid-binding protein